MFLENTQSYLSYPLFAPSLSASLKKLCDSKEIDLIQCEKSYLSRYLAGGINLPAVLVEHEVLSATFLEQARSERSPLKKIILCLRAVKKSNEEKKWYGKFRQIVVFTQEDKDLIRRSTGLENVTVISLGSDLDSYPPLSTRKDYELVFVGNFSHAPNLDAVLYFSKKIMPLVLKDTPGARLLVAGYAPAEARRKLACLGGNISILGYVPDILSSYAQGKVFVAPLRYGTGMRFKVIEALMMGLPVVATPLGARGFIHDQCIKTAENEKDFARAVSEILRSADYDGLAEEARSFAGRHYNLEVLLSGYEKIYAGLIPRTKSPG